MSSLFKTRYVPNADGSESATALTDANTVFVHTYLGDDNTGDGTRAKPYRSATKAMLKGGTYMVFRGVINEYFSQNKYIIGDDINQSLIYVNYAPLLSQLTAMCNLSTDFIRLARYNGPLYRILHIGTLYNTSDFAVTGIYNSLISSIQATGSNTQGGYISNTIKVLNNNGNFWTKNCIITKYLYLSGSSSNLLNACFPSTCLFLYGTNIQPAFTDDSAANVGLLRAILISAGMTSAFATSLFPKDSFGNEICRIIKESRCGGSHPNIFNKYEANASGVLNASISGARTTIALNTISGTFPTTGDIFLRMADGTADIFTYTSWSLAAGIITFTGASQTLRSHLVGEVCTRYGDVLDFTLNPDPLNEALWASDTGGYVGCFRPAVDGIINVANTIIDVNPDGTDTANAGTLMLVDASGNLVFNYSSVQIWNRMRDQNTISIPVGSNFKGLSAMSQDGSPFGHYLGKKQNLIDTTVVNAGDVLTVGQMYKVFNDSYQDVTKSVVYNGVQYLPEFTFMCLASPTTFSLLNSGSGTYIKKVLADVLESIEIQPYDDISNPSATFPKFSAPLLGECKLLYYTSAGATRYGKTSGTPVIFSDLSVANMITDFGSINNQSSIYNNFAISNADQEFFTLANPSLTSPRSTYFTVSIPVLRFLRREINGHFDQPYDY